MGELADVTVADSRHEAQICYCGEPNCVGTIGGKTQTDIGGMDDLFLEALGILDEVNSGGMKGSRKKKARHLDEDYVPILTPITDPAQANKVSAAMRQSVENPTMMGRLIERVKVSCELEAEADFSSRTTPRCTGK